MTNDKNDVSAAAELVVTDDRRVGNVSTVPLPAVALHQWTRSGIQ